MSPKVYLATMMGGACSSLHKRLSLSNVLHSPRRRLGELSCKAMAPGPDAIQTLRKFEASEVSGRLNVAELPPVRQMSSLQKMQLSDALRMVRRKADFQWRLENVFVPGKLDGEAVESGTTAFSTITANDGASCILLVLNSVLPRLETARLLLPRGAAVAVKEPLLAATLGGSTPVLVAQCHAAVEFFDLEEACIGEEEAGALLEQGNKMFSDGQYILAAQKYGCILSKLSEGDEYVQAASNRAACFIELKRFEDAVVDCNMSLDVNPKHSKSLERKAVALAQLAEYKQALKCLEHAEKNRVTEALRTRCSTLVKQAENQSYNLDDYYSSGCKETKIPECSDYLGPVEVRMTKDGKGRGLFLTSDVVAGQLLLVSNAIVYVDNRKSRLSAVDLQRNVEVEALRLCGSSSRLFAQIKALADTNKAPDMRLFKTGFDGMSKNRCSVPLEVPLVFRTLRRLSFGVSVPDEEAPSHGGAWGLPALINHSCLPNVSFDFVGAVLFMRASRQLRAGQELLLSYVEALTPWCTERSMANSWSFSCNCQRCILEKRHDRVLRDVLETDPQERPNEDEEDWLERLASFCVKLEVTLERLRLSQTEENWIRATAAREYVICLCNMEKVKRIVARCPKFPTALQLIKIIHETAPGQFMTSRLVAKLTGACLNEETMAVCVEELSSRYGWEVYLKPKLVGELVSWLKTPEAMDTYYR